MRDVLVSMLEIYQPNGIDWMGYQVTSDNPYTFHHINEKREGGKYEISNGAILTKQAHEYLNYLDAYSPLAYLEYQRIFKFINSINGPIPNWLKEELLEKIEYLEYEIHTLKKYPISEIPRNIGKELKEKKKQAYLNKTMCKSIK